MTYIVLVIHKYIIGNVTQVLNMIAVSDSQGFCL